MKKKEKEKKLNKKKVDHEYHNLLDNNLLGPLFVVV